MYFFFYSLLNEQGLISKNHMKARTYPNVAKKLVWNPFPGNRHDDSMRIFLLQQGRTRARAGTFTSSLHTEDHNIACSYSTGEKNKKKNMQPMQMSVILVYGPVTQGQQGSALTDTSPKSNRGRWATGCLVEVNPSSPVAPAFGSREKIPDVALVLVLERI